MDQIKSDFINKLRIILLHPLANQQSTLGSGHTPAAVSLDENADRGCGGNGKVPVALPFSENICEIIRCHQLHILPQVRYTVISGIERPACRERAGHGNPCLENISLRIKDILFAHFLELLSPHRLRIAVLLTDPSFNFGIVCPDPGIFLFILGSFGA